ncbi:MAG: hypothetical protein KF773_35725 [Deltaproteobacteria bacterium]|nr:hypothetical protein [Deltaproteobacteria bacterium]
MRHLVLFLLIGACGEVLVTPDAKDLVDADPCTGTCECRVDTDCSDGHAVCDDQGTSRTCTCAFGYAPGVGGACEWNGVVADPGFQATTRWTAGDNVTVDANLNVAGMIDPGAARFSAMALCDFSRVTQTLEMPRLSRAEPLVVEIAYRMTSFMDFNSPTVGIGPSWIDDLPRAGGTFQTSRSCLGSAQYASESTRGKGASVDLVVMPTREAFFCADTSMFMDVDRIEIKPANPGECPLPGTALNGDAEGEGGWQFQISANDQSSARIEAGVGEANSRGARLFMHHRCQGVALSNKISVPTADAVASPAISMFNRTSANSRMQSNIGTLAGPEVLGTGVGQTFKMCVPAFMRGSTLQLRANIESGGLCADVVNFESVFDNLKIVNEPTCGTDSTISDPGFESPLPLIGAHATPGKSLVRAVNDPAAAHSGSGALQLSVTQLCDGPRWETRVRVPPSSGTSGPALRFFYKASPMGSYRFTVNTSRGSLATTLDNTYHEGTICLDPRFVGRDVPVVFSMSGGGGTCANVIPAEQAFVDDLAVVMQDGCPTM